MFTCFFFFFKQKTAYEMRISDWSSDVCSSDLVRGAAKHVWMVSIGVAALVGLFACGLFAVPSLPGDSGLNTPPVEIVRKADGIQYATRRGEIRTVKLSDGSKLTIDTETLVTIDFGQTARHLRLEHGRARFEVAHEARPFVVDAGEVVVIASGTVVEVSYLEDRRVKVQLLHGAVDVTQKGSRAGASTLRLQPGGIIDGKSVGWGKRVSVRVGIGGRRRM